MPYPIVNDRLRGWPWRRGRAGLRGHTGFRTGVRLGVAVGLPVAVAVGVAVGVALVVR
jgi:hypothetical protein